MDRAHAKDVAGDLVEGVLRGGAEGRALFLLRIINTINK